MKRQALPWILCALLATILLAQNAGVRLGSLGITRAEASDMAEPKFNQEQGETPKPVYEAADLIKQRAESERPYLPFLNIATMDLGIYSLPKGGTDGQSPHALDEIYYVIHGKAKINISGTAHAVQPGSIIFVAAGDEHKFEEIEEDLDLLVFFSKATPEKN